MGFFSRRRSPPPGTVRRDDHETSRQAAFDLEPQQMKLRALVLQFAKEAGTGGLTDEDLVLHAPDRPESSLRKRRTELAERNWIVEAGFTRRNRHGEEMKVWIHRDYAVNPPMILSAAAVKEAKKRWSVEDERAAVARYLRGQTVPLSALADEIEAGDHIR